MRFKRSSFSLAGVTQELIDETRLSSEKIMLEDLKMAASNKEDLEFRGRSGETPVSWFGCYGHLIRLNLVMCVLFHDLDYNSWLIYHIWL